MTKITVNDAEFRRGMARLRKFGQGQTFLTDLGEALLFEIDQSFEKQEDPHGRPWQDLAPITKALRRGGPPYRILQDTGVLASSITQRVSRKRLVIGTNLEYAALHNFGGVIRPKRAKALFFGSFKRDGATHKVFAQKAVIPKRPFLPGRLPRSWEKVAIATARRHLRRLS